MTDHDPLDLESQICFALAVASRGVIGAYRSVLDPLHLTHPQYLVMLALWRHGRLPVRRIAEMLRLEPATVSPLVKRLEALDYVTRTRAPPTSASSRSTSRRPGPRAHGGGGDPPAMMEKLGMDEAGLRALHATMTDLIAAVDASNAAEEKAAG
ncbi:MarR family transcriptional regulator [Brevibacterium casei]|nr:MarR family transcriptional regulator [Brevibacterium casei]